MPRLRVHGFGLSFDGFGAGPAQDADHPLGRGAEAIMEWFFRTETFHRMTGKTGGATDTDDEFAARGFAGIGAWIIGRNMFGPVRGPWPDLSWTGWWGEDPPFHTPVFVLTHHPRPPLVMQGGTVFHFVADGIEAALRRATEAAGTQDIRLGGGVDTIRQYLRAGLIDELHLAQSPVLLGEGEQLMSGLDLPSLGYRCASHTATANALHVILMKAG
jgi:dihydrofolate reductase